MEAFGDAIVFGEAPHAGDFFLPLLTVLANGAKPLLVNCSTKSMSLCAMGRHCLAGAMLYGEQFRQRSHLTMKNVDSWVLSEEPEKVLVLRSRQRAWLFAQGRKDLTLFSDLRGRSGERDPGHDAA